MQNPQTLQFLEPPSAWRRRETAAYQILPVPFEATVSYGGGTAGGPRAILEASTQVELFDGFDEPARAGIFTHPLPAAMTDDPEVMIGQVARQVKEIVAAPAVPVLLGGEHTISVGAFRGLAESAALPFGVVQFDAHADLRDTYQDTPYSHACVMRRALDLKLPIAQFGVRSLCREEAELRQAEGIFFRDAADLQAPIPDQPILPHDFPRNIYITFDVDGLDPAVVPATGTPEPGGLSWYTALRLLEQVVRGRRVLGFDMVELAPLPGQPASDFIVAKLVYAIIGLIQRHANPTLAWGDSTATGKG